MDRHQTVSILLLLAGEYAGVLLAVSADLVSGLRKARREGRRCTSRGLRRTVAKLSSYYLALFSLTVIDAMTMGALAVLASGGGPRWVAAFPYLTTFGALGLALIELKSVGENMPERGRLRAGAEWFASVLKKIQGLRRGIS